MIATQDVTCPNCGESSRIRKVLTARNVQSFANKPQQFTCPKCGTAMERGPGSDDWKPNPPESK